MKPTSLPLYGIGNKFKMGRYTFEVFQITYRGEYRYSGNLYKDGRLMNGASISEYALLKDGVLQ